jgi:PST family polysaccharide transporter
VTATLRRHTVLNAPGTAIPGLAAFIAFIAVAHLTSTRTLGLLTLAWITANLGSSVVALGPAHAALRSLHAEEPDPLVLARFRRLVVERALVTAAAVAVLGVALMIAGNEVGPGVLLAAPWLLGQSGVLFEAETLRARQRFGAASALLSIRAVVGWAGVVIAAVFTDNLAALILPTALTGIVVAAIASRAQVAPVTDAVRRQSRVIGGPIGRLAAASYALGYADRYVVQFFLGPAAVGVYTLGYQLGEGGVELFTQPVTGATLPRVVAEWHNPDGGRARARRTTLRVAAAIVAFTVVTPLAVYGADRLGWLERIDPSPDLPAITAIVCVAVGIQGLTRLGYGLLLAQGRTDTAFRVFLEVVALSAVVVPLLTWWSGLVGAAWATLIAYAVLASLTMWSAFRGSTQ